MFGKNQTAKIAHDQSGDSLEVHSIFYTIQGEGPHAGEPAIFIRLAGCNLKCHFCDTEFERFSTASVEEIVDRVMRANKDSASSLVVLTGGEPMRQQIVPLVEALDEAGYYTQIETAGTCWPPGLEKIIVGACELVCSPKTPKVHPKVETMCQHWKYIIRKGEISALDGLPNMSTQVPGSKAELFRPHDCTATIWVQPCAEYYPLNLELINPEASMENAQECVRIAMLYGYRVSVQVHKILGLE